MHILLIRFSSLGDIVLQTSFISWLKITLKDDVKISLLTLSGNDVLVQGLDDIEVITYTKCSGLKDLLSLKKLAKNLKNQIDLVIDLHGTTRSFLLKSFLYSVPAMSMDKRRIERWLLVNTKLNLLDNQNSIHLRHIDDWHQLLYGEHFDARLIYNFHLKNGYKESLLRSRVSKSSASEKIISLAPGASFDSKKWGSENFYQLAQKILESYLDHKVFIIAGPEDKECEIFDQLQAKYRNRLFNFQGRLSLADSLERVAKSSLVITNDSVMGHVAESCGIAAFVLFGPTSPDFGFAPHLEKSKLFYRNISCSPCSTTGKKPCYRDEKYCMKEITVDEVFSSITQMIEVSENV